MAESNSTAESNREVSCNNTPTQEEKKDRHSKT